MAFAALNDPKSYSVGENESWLNFKPFSGLIAGPRLVFLGF